VLRDCADEDIDARADGDANAIKRQKRQTEAAAQGGRCGDGVSLFA
jgi:hypothetical protein